MQRREIGELMKKSDVRFPGYDSYPRWLVLAALACGLPIFLYFSFAGNPVRGFAASLSMGSLVIVIVTLWDLRNYMSFWFATLLNILVHSALIYFVSGSDSHFPGIILAPIFILDFLFWQFISVSAVRVLGFR
jgi:hypothetical protein